MFLIIILANRIFNLKKKKRIYRLTAKTDFTVSDSDCTAKIHNLI